MYLFVVLTTASTNSGRIEDLSNPQPLELSFSPIPSQAKHEGSAATNTQQQHSLRVTQASKTTFIIVFAFVLCWLPHTLISITSTLCKACYLKIPPQVSSFLLMMGYLNSAINPVIYSFRNPRFKEAIKGILRNRCRVLTLSGKQHNGQKSGTLRKSGGSRVRRCRVLGEHLERRTNTSRIGPISSTDAVLKSR